MTEIHELLESGKDVVKSNDSFPEAEGSYPPTDELADHVRVLDVDGADVDNDRLQASVDAAVSEFNLGRRSQRTALDSNLAPIVRECIDIPTRVAARPGVWQYFTLLEYPDLILKRWSRDDDIQEKFLGSQKDLYSNYIARLWWGAELTHNESTGDYFVTHRLFNKQRLVNYFLDSSFRRYRPAARGFAAELYRETGEDITDIAKRFNASLSTIQLESRDEEQVREQLAMIRQRVNED